MRDIFTRVTRFFGFDDSRVSSVANFFVSIGIASVAGVEIGIWMSIFTAMLMAASEKAELGNNPFKAFWPIVFSGMLGVMASTILVYAFTR
jgi:hypothetical protein